MKIGKITIRRAKDIYTKIEIEPRTLKEKGQWYFLVGVYESRILGLCFYRNRIINKQ